MLVKLINNPWISDKLPDGLTIGNTYKCIERMFYYVNE